MAYKRKRIPMRKSKRQFRKGASMTHRKNLMGTQPPPSARGGVRL